MERKLSYYTSNTHLFSMKCIHADNVPYSVIVSSNILLDQVKLNLHILYFTVTSLHQQTHGKCVTRLSQLSTLFGSFDDDYWVDDTMAMAPVSGVMSSPGALTRYAGGMSRCRCCSRVRLTAPVAADDPVSDNDNFDNNKCNKHAQKAPQMKLKTLL